MLSVEVKSETNFKAPGPIAPTQPTTAALYFKEWDPTNMALGPPKRDMYNNLSYSVTTTDKKPITVQLRRGRSKWGGNKFEPKPKPGSTEADKSSFTVDYLVDLDSTDPDVMLQTSKFRLAENMVKGFAKQNAATWFPQEDSPEQVAGLFKSMIVKPSADRHTDLPHITFELKPNFPNKIEAGKPETDFQVKCYPDTEIRKQAAAAERGEVYEPQGVSPMTIQRGSEIIPLVTFERISMHGGRYRLKTRLESLVFIVPPGVVTQSISLSRDEEA
jgi:hypothetical protein